jgi:serine/threonine protein kinase
VKALHDRRVAHRDLKPENVLVTDDEHVLLCDLGISLAIAEGRHDNRLTRAMEQIGSRHYMAPEALAGRLEAGDEQFALDVYAVGKLIYELLDGKILPGIESHRSQQRLLTARNSDFDVLVNRLLDGLLNSDPQIRLRIWTRVDNSLRMLTQALSGQPQPETDDWKDAELRLSAALARRQGAIAQKSDDSALDWQRIVTETGARTVERIATHPGMRLIKYLVEESEGLATVQAIPSGPHPRELLEGAYVRSHYGVDPLAAAGWEVSGQPASFRAFTILARDQKSLPSYWILLAIARHESRLRMSMAIVKKDSGDKPFIDVLLGSVRVLDFDPLDLSMEETMWQEALPLVQQLFDQLISDVTPSK